MKELLRFAAPWEEAMLRVHHLDRTDAERRDVTAAWAALRPKREVRDFLAGLEEQLLTTRRLVERAANPDYVFANGSASEVQIIDYH